MVGFRIFEIYVVVCVTVTEILGCFSVYVILEIYDFRLVTVNDSRIKF